jgi:teichuronic acid exporter
LSKSLKEKTITGMMWSSVHRFGSMSISFIANIVLARLLTPEDFGIIGMIMVFIAISGTLVDGGFASALIQKKKPTKEDYSTIFYWNLILSLVLFILIYIASPAIERFYEMSTLSSLLRVLGIVLILNAFNIIQTNQLIKNLNFKRLANINIVATLLSAVIGIVMAYMGYGVWSLVAKLISVSLFQSIFLWYLNRWRPSFEFSFSSLKELFGFGSYMLLSSFIIETYDNLKSLIIGKVFSAADLGFYVQAERMRSVPVQGLSSVVNQVTFPVFSELQDDKESLVKGVKKSIKAITFINFPLMVITIIIAHPLIILLLTEQWVISATYLQILCVGGMVYTLNTINNNILKSLGESKLYFIVLTLKRITGIIFILIGLNYGITGLLWGVVINNYVSFLISMYYASKMSGYKIIDQINDILPAYLLAIIVGFIIYYTGIKVNVNNFYMILIQVPLYTIIYIVISYLFRMDSVLIFNQIIKEKLVR